MSHHHPHDRHHLVIGAGPVGTATARHLVRLGRRVTIATRSGSGPAEPGIDRRAIDATDVTALTAAADGVEAIHNCANPPYHRWSVDWPPLATAMLDAAEATGARLVTASNLYGFPRGASPMCASDPLDPPSRKGAVRVEMWRQALDRHDAGRVEVAEVRGSDFVGPGVGESAHLGSRFVAAVLRGSSPRIVGPSDVEHSWTYVDDLGRLMAVCGTDDRAIGRAWHVPTVAPRTAQAMADAIADAAAVERVAVKRVPPFLLRLGGVVSPLVRELPEVRYQFDEPFVIDATDTTDVFSIDATPFETQIRAIIGTTSGVGVAATT